MASMFLGATSITSYRSYGLINPDHQRGPAVGRAWHAQPAAASRCLVLPEESGRTFPLDLHKMATQMATPMAN